MTTEATIRLAPGTELDAQSLPTQGAIAAAIDVRQVAVSNAPGLVRIQIEYQTFVAPEEAMQIRVPAYTLVFRKGDTAFPAKIPFWSFYSSPFRHERAAVTDPAVLRSDHAVASRDLGTLWIGLCASIGTAAICLFVLAGMRGWRPHFNLHSAPFARAVRQVRKSDRNEAMIALHRAFDATAGTRVLAGDVDQFLTAHSAFAPLKGDIERFFGASRATFFKCGTVEMADMLALARRLRRAERAA